MTKTTLKQQNAETLGALYIYIYIYIDSFTKSGIRLLDDSLLNEEIYYSKINLLFKQIGSIYYVNRIEKNIIKQEKVEMVGLESKKC